MTGRDDRLFNPGVQWGLVLAVVFIGASLISPRYGQPVLWAALSIHLAFGGVVCWRRMRLQLTALTMFLGTIGLVLLGVLQGFEGHAIGDWPPRWWAVLVGLFIVGVICGAIDRRVHEREWTEWERYMADKNAWDMFLMRHIPDLRTLERRDIS